LNANSRRDLICALPREKVDIYAAGLVLFEMCGQFKTQMERCINIDKLKNERKFPKGFEDKFYMENTHLILFVQEQYIIHGRVQIQFLYH
jgi:hypothetical protein